MACYKWSFGGLFNEILEGTSFLIKPFPYLAFLSELAKSVLK